MSLTDTLTNNPTLIAELLDKIGSCACQSNKYPYEVIFADEVRTLILSWAARVDVEAVSDSEKRHTAPECGPEGPDFSL